MKQTYSIWLDDPRIEKEGDFFVAYLDQLNLVACGATAEEASEELTNVVKTSFKGLDKQGVLFKTLDKIGIKYEAIEPQRVSSTHSRKPITVGV
jgi:predicted RNase H-like HicB family nuclease